MDHSIASNLADKGMALLFSLLFSLLLCLTVQASLISPLTLP